MKAEQNNEGRRWGECESCGFETWLEEYQAGPPDEGVLAHCEVCAKTWIGRASEYPTHYGVDVAAYKSMGRIANMILARQLEQFEIIMGLLFAIVDPTLPLPMTPGENQILVSHAEFVEHIKKYSEPFTEETLGG